MRKGSMTLCHAFGIDIEVHFTFALLLAWVSWEGFQAGGWVEALNFTLLVILLFVCVTLHEFGHALTARRYGVRTRRILLMPIGGMAQFDYIPRRPWHEFMITIFGPLVNFALAALLYPIWRSMPEGQIAWFCEQLLYINLAMGLFNLLPVFPMDGGRILRALLATRTSYLEATRLASIGGKILAIIGILYAGANGRFILVLLFGFIYMAGHSEYHYVRRWEALVSPRKQGNDPLSR